MACVCITSADPHERMIVRTDWVPTQRVSPAAPHTVLFAIKQRNVANGVLTQRLMAVSDPDSPMYGQHLTFAQVDELTANHDASRCVHAYLGQIGAEVVSTTREFVRAKASVQVWETAFDTTFFQYHHRPQHGMPQRGPIVRTAEYTLPEALASCIDFVGYTSQLPGRDKPVLRAIPLDVTNKPGTVDPTLLKSNYNIDSFTASPKVSQAVFEAVKADYSPEDLAEWLEYYSFPDQKVARDFSGHNSSATCKTTMPAACIEGNLDVQYLMGTAQGPPTTYWYEANETWPFIAWMEEVLADKNPVTVHSVSYDEPEYHVPATLKEFFSTSVQKLGLMGTTVVVSSGDDGVAGAEARANKTACSFRPYFPAACPYVTAVGATMGPENYLQEISETADAHPSGGITTGGGFSQFYPQPSYQTEFVKTYISTAAMPLGNYNTSNRAYPDVALLGHMYQVMIGGTQFGVSGTSASAPVVAGMINLLNSKRLAAGKSLLGFVNPLLYKNPSVFNDMTTGNNKCTAQGGGALVCCPVGFDSIAGWDPLTGLGSVDFQKASAAFV